MFGIVGVIVQTSTRISSIDTVTLSVAFDEIRKLSSRAPIGKFSAAVCQPSLLGTFVDQITLKRMSLKRTTRAVSLSGALIELM